MLLSMAPSDAKLFMLRPSINNKSENVLNVSAIQHEEDVHHLQQIVPHLVSYSHWVPSSKVHHVGRVHVLLL